MRRTKGTCCVATRLHLVALMTIILALILSGCGQTASQNKISVSRDAVSAPLPNVLMALSLNETNLIVEVIVNGAAPQTCANLSVDQMNGTFSCDITLPAGTHSLVLNYSVIDVIYGTVQIATTSGIEVTIVTGQTTSADFTMATLTHDDNDGDGISNLVELNEGSNPATPSYYVGGTISGLSGSGAVIQLNGGNDLILTRDGSFKLIPAVAGNGSYIVTVLTQPGSPNQTCTVGNDKGAVNSTAITNVTVTCMTTLYYTIGVTVTGLVGGELVLQSNGGDDLLINANGNFTFATALPDGSAYAITVLIPPADPNQRCTIESSEVFLDGRDTNVTVNCQLMLFVSADDGLVDRELFATDGTVAGTFLVKDINTSADADPRNLVVVRNVTYFVATDGITGRELWRTNGTTAGTVLVKDIRPGSSGASLGNLTAVGNTLYFSANDSTSGAELWKSDGTNAGTVLVKDIDSGLFGANPNNLTTVGNTLYFSAFDGNGFDEWLWKSDGTDAGTVRVKRITPGGSSNILYPSNLTVMDNMLYFNFFGAFNGINGSELWKSDGTDAGTVLVKNIDPESSSTYLNNFVAVGSTLYFSTNNSTNLWKSDGTSAGTVLVKNIQPGSSSTYPNNLTAVGNTLYFRANDDTSLWKSDGTDTGTMIIKNIQSGSSGTNLGNLTAVGNTLYFSADDATNGEELWKSDGTTAGTVMVKDIRSGSSGASPDNLTAVGSTLYFSADDGANGRELWKSDGTDTGTGMVIDINLNFGAGSNPVPLM